MGYTFNNRIRDNFTGLGELLTRTLARCGDSYKNVE